jgi:histidyl-tRNA synthetase
MLGERELASGRVALKDMQGGEQTEISLLEVVAQLQQRVQAKDATELTGNL